MSQLKNAYIAMLNTKSNKLSFFYIKNEVISQYLKDAFVFKQMIGKILSEMKQDLADHHAYTGLPTLTTALSNRWMAQSNVGEEFINPPVTWCFEERVEIALTNEDCPLVTFNNTLKKDEFIAILEKILGENALVSKKIKTIKNQTAFDDYMDELFDNI